MYNIVLFSIFRQFTNGRNVKKLEMRKIYGTALNDSRSQALRVCISDFGAISSASRREKYFYYGGSWMWQLCNCRVLLLCKARQAATQIYIYVFDFSSVTINCTC